MILLFLIVFSSVTISQQQGPECIVSGAALGAQTSCLWAVGNITLRTASSDQVELVCNDTLGCKNLTRNYVRDCTPVSYNNH